MIQEIKRLEEAEYNYSSKTDTYSLAGDAYKMSVAAKAVIAKLKSCALGEVTWQRRETMDGDYDVPMPKFDRTEELINSLVCLNSSGRLWFAVEGESK